MEKIRLSDLLKLCRLCGQNGNHEANILERDADVAGNNENQLSEKIFRCVGVQVSASIYNLKFRDGEVTANAVIISRSGQVTK